MVIKQFDVIVIGAGQAGVPLAKKLAKAGKKVALIEKRWMGGTCVNDGCTPTKTWVASAKAAYMAANSAHLGVKTKKISIDLREIKKRKDSIVLNARNGIEKSMSQTAGLTVFHGTAAFNGVKTLLVDLNDGGKKQIKADLIFI